MWKTRHKSSVDIYGYFYSVICGADSVEGLGDGCGRRGRLLPRLQRDCVGDEHRGRAQIHATARTDHAPQRPRHQEPLRDPLRPREHQPLHAGTAEVKMSQM